MENTIENAQRFFEGSIGSSDIGYSEYIAKLMVEYTNKVNDCKQGDVIPSLLAAGKLALAARLVTTANAKNISQRIENMEAALDAYDNEILSLRNEAYVIKCDERKALLIDFISWYLNVFMRDKKLTKTKTPIQSVDIFLKSINSL